MITRKPTNGIYVGNVKIGDYEPVSIQSMITTDPVHTEKAIAEINRLADAGCELVRVAVPTMESAKALKAVRAGITIPLIADIHFDYRLAIAAMENGADKIRINPGNIGSAEKLRAVIDVAKKYSLPIRVGVNSGSLEKEVLLKYGTVTSEALVESALNNAKLIEDMDYHNLVISIKSSNVMECIKAHELIASRTDIPLHVGITESGSLIAGNIKSSVGLGIILYQGIGDTIRVSLTGSPVEEIKSAKMILKALGLRKGGAEIVSCPTCGRTDIDLIGLEEKVNKLLEDYMELDIKVAVMGCVVNGPGEAREADLGVCGGKNAGLIIKKGEIIKRLPESELLNGLKEELDILKAEKGR